MKHIIRTLRWLIPPHQLTNGPTVGPSVGRTVGDLGGGEIHTESSKSMREGDTGNEWNGRSVGWSVGQMIGEVNKQNKRV